MQKANPSDIPGNSRDSSHATINDCASNESEMEKMSNKVEKLSDTVNLLLNQMVEQNQLFQQNLKQQSEQSRLNFEAKIKQNEEWNEKLCALQRGIQEIKKGNAEKVETIGKKINDDLKKKIGYLVYKLSIRFSSKVHFVKVENNWHRTDGKCCGYKCILSNPDGNCKEGNGIVKLSDVGKANYLEGNEDNWPIKVFAKNAFKKSVDFSTSSSNVDKTLSFFYFEEKIIRIENYFAVGLETNKCEYYVDVGGDYWNGSNWEKFFPRKLKNGDVVGCGLIFIATIFSDSNRPKLFFILNGKKFSYFPVLENKDIDSEFFPFVCLWKCDVETNFGEKKFVYKIEKMAI